jgi:hypothetical protein
MVVPVVLALLGLSIVPQVVGFVLVDDVDSGTLKLAIRAVRYSMVAVVACGFVTALGAAALLLAATASPANAAHNKYSASVYAGSTLACYASIKNSVESNPHSDVKGTFEAYSGFGCQGWLERKTDEYNWKRVSDNYFVSSGEWRQTAWHWNGGSAQSRVCIVLTANSVKDCSTGL